MCLSSAHARFTLPTHLSLSEQVSLCVKTIATYRQELKPLRNRLGILQKQQDNARRKQEYWKQQYEQAKRENDRLKEENKKLKQEITKLTKTRERYRVSLFDHGNFAHPNQGRDKKPRGGQGGHADTNREAKADYDSYQRRRIYAKTCGHCHSPLPRVDSTKEKLLIDIIINPTVIKLILESERQWCRTCQTEVNAKDGQSLPFTEYGVNVFMLVLLLRFRCGLSLSKVATVLAIGFGLSVSKAGLVNMLSQAKTYLNDRYDELIRAVRAGQVMYNDETGWWVRGKQAWMWIAVNETTTVYYAAESRGKGIAEELYGNSTAKSMHDGLASYTKAIPKEHQLYCWAHVLRFAFEETHAHPPDSRAVAMREELVAIYRLRHVSTGKQLEQHIGQRLDALLTIDATDETAQAIHHRIASQKEGLIRALLFTPDGTNNLAERELRPIAIARTTSYGSDTYTGMETTAILASVVQTAARKPGDTFFHDLKASLTAGMTKRYHQYAHVACYDST